MNSSFILVLLPMETGGWLKFVSPVLTTSTKLDETYYLNSNYRQFYHFNP